MRFAPTPDHLLAAPNGTPRFESIAAAAKPHPVDTAAVPAETGNRRAGRSMPPHTLQNLRTIKSSEKHLMQFFPVQLTVL
jgi:hypothetical protein